MLRLFFCVRDGRAAEGVPERSGGMERKRKPGQPDPERSGGERPNYKVENFF